MSSFQDSDVFLFRDSLSRPWGFRMQGGADFNYPLTIQRVFSGSPAEGQLLRGDVILAFDGYDVGRLTHKQAQDVVRVASSQLKIRVRRPYFGNPQPLIQTGARSKSTSPQTDPASSYFASHEAPKPSWQPSSGPPLGDFGVQYGSPKSPGGVKFIRNVSSPNPTRDHSPNHEADLALQRMQDSLTKLTMNNNEDDPVDYSFMKKSVSERKKAFMQPPADSRPRAASCTPQLRHGGNYPSIMTSSYTEPSYSPPYQDHYRAPHKTGYSPKTASLPRRGDFGWAPSPEKLAAARRAPQPCAASQVQHSVYNPHDDIDSGPTEADQWMGGGDSSWGRQPLLRSTSVSVLHEAPTRNSYVRPQESVQHQWTRQHSQPAPTKKFSTSATIRVGGGRGGSQPSRVVRRFSASSSPFDGTMSLDRRHHPEPLKITIGSSWNADYHPAYPANVLGPSGSSHEVYRPVAHQPAPRGRDFYHSAQKPVPVHDPAQKAAAREIQHHISRAQTKTDQVPAFSKKPSQIRAARGALPKPQPGTYRPLQQSYSNPARWDDPDYMSSDF